MTESDRETRDRILEASHTVFMRRGTAGARTQEIADEAGVNKALLHYYFGSKEALATAVFERAVAELFPRVFAILQSEMSIEDKVRTIVPAYIDFLAARPYLPGYVASEMHAHPDRIRRIFGERGPVPLDVLRRQIAAEVAAGTMRPIEPEHFVANLLSPIVFPFIVRPALEVMLQLAPDRFPAFLEERKRMLPEFFLHAIRP